MQLKYEDGPDTITMGIAGQFRKGEAREVDDTLAETLLKKESIKFKKIEESSTKRRDK